jgi:hypothetical protein
MAFDIYIYALGVHSLGRFFWDRLYLRLSILLVIDKYLALSAAQTAG